jgi:hypothetical protein
MITAIIIMAARNELIINSKINNFRYLLWFMYLLLKNLNTERLTMEISEVTTNVKRKPKTQVSYLVGLFSSELCIWYNMGTIIVTTIIIPIKARQRNFFERIEPCIIYFKN